MKTELSNSCMTPNGNYTHKILKSRSKQYKMLYSLVKKYITLTKQMEQAFPSKCGCS